jgi:hypothetical protein
MSSYTLRGSSLLDALAGSLLPFDGSLTLRVKVEQTRCESGSIPTSGTIKHTNDFAGFTRAHRDSA